MNEAENLARGVRDGAAAAGSHVVPTTLDTGDRLAMPSASLSPDEIVALVHAVRPPIIYLFESVLDLEQEIEAALDEAGINEDGKAARAVRRAAERLRPHEGQTARVFAEVVAGGVYHVAYVAAAWINAFEEEVKAIADRAAEEDVTRVRQMSAAAHAHTRELAQQLVAHPAFNSGRVSFAKRRFLAGDLFPEEDDARLNAVVELAENMQWLASARE